MHLRISRRTLAALSGAVAVCYPMLALGDVTFLGAFSTFGTFAGQIGGGIGEALDPSGNLYVADTINNRVEEFSSTGTFLQNIGAAGGSVTLAHPFGVGIGSTGLIYTASTNPSHIDLFNSDGSPNRVFVSGGSLNGQVSKPEDLAVNSLGTVFVADTNNHRVQAFNSSGTFLQVIGSQGSGPGQFDQPISLAISPAPSSLGQIFVVDSDAPSVTTNRRVEIFDSAGNFVSTFGQYGTGNGQFVSPQGVAVSSTGRVYVTDGSDFNHPTSVRVEVFNDSGTFLSAFGQTPGAGQLSSVTGIAVAPNGQLYVMNGGFQVFRYFDPASWANGVNSFVSAFSGPIDVGVGTGQILGQTLNLDPTKGLIVAGATTVAAGGSLTVSGGSFSTGSLVVSGAGASFVFTGGTVGATTISVNQGGRFDANHGNAISIPGPISISDSGSQFIVEQGATISAATFTNGPGAIVALNTNGLLTASNPSTNAGSINLAGGALTIHGTLTNQPGGAIQGDGNLTADAGITNSGTIALAGASNVTGAVNNTAAGVIRLSGIQPNVFFNDVSNDGTITIDAGSGATFLGMFSGSHGISGAGTAFLDGPVSPGHSAAAIRFGGGVSFGAASSQIIELGGTTRGTQYDAIDITGAAALDGVMTIEAICGFTPLPGESFQVLTFGSRTGDVTIVNQTGFAGLQFVKNFSPTSLTLTATGLAGDANLDGVVNSSDFTALAAHFNQSGQNWLSGDFNGDGRVNALDFNALASDFGTASGVSPLGALLPEPGSLLIALGLILKSRRHRRRSAVPEKSPCNTQTSDEPA